MRMVGTVPKHSMMPHSSARPRHARRATLFHRSLAACLYNERFAPRRGFPRVTRRFDTLWIAARHRAPKSRFFAFS
ncbi:hypothetical protein AYM40_16990 [Paraburkholderia phytofirmans OLGA172]|uniref:Uncharacterized protein n=1 Tax=Paraburkholderia phytofirmans OLGA172 TaxID=1417228 RepID=A0A160FMJ1_9BURK|nr:hypothetical protein AYM40_16990 [Paraburkholderia phytofirmans OLGA172]